MRQLLWIVLLGVLGCAVAQTCTTNSCNDGQYCNGLEQCDSGSGLCSPQTDPGTLASLCNSFTLTRQCATGYCNSALQTCGAYTGPSLGNPCGLSNVGVCRIGTISCNANTSSLVCTGRVDPSQNQTVENVANGLDDDCDGIVDEGVIVPCSSSLDCQTGTDCIDVSCTSGFCRYTPKNNGLSCNANGPSCLAPYFCNSRGQCLARSTIACTSSPYSTDPTTRSDCLVSSCASGECSISKWQGPCDDGNACTVNDACSPAGVCLGTAVACNDNDACTTDYCNNGVCVYTAIPNCNNNGQQQVFIASSNNINVTAQNATTLSTSSVGFILLIVLPVTFIAIIGIVVITVCVILTLNKEHTASMKKHEKNRHQ